MHDTTMLGVYTTFDPPAPTKEQHDEWANELFATVHFPGVVDAAGSTFVAGLDVQVVE